MTPRLLPLLLTAGALLAGTCVHASSLQASASQAATWREEARALEHGEGVTKDVEAAIGLYCKAAMAGDVLARYNLGWIYANGRGTERNDAFAAYFVQQAAEQGDAMAARLLPSLGPTRAKAPCVLQAEAAERGRLAREKAEAQAAEQRRQQEEAQLRYLSLAETVQQKRILAIVQRLAPEYGIEPGLAVALIRAESNFNPSAVSEKNAQGLMQLIPETAARFRVKKPFDPEQNIRGGMSYLRWLLAYFQGDVDLAVAAYNAGEGAVDKYGGVPPYPETRGYVKRIREIFQLQHHPFDGKITEPSTMLRAGQGKAPRA